MRRERQGPGAYPGVRCATPAPREYNPLRGKEGPVASWTERSFLVYTPQGLHPPAGVAYSRSPGFGPRAAEWFTASEFDFCPFSGVVDLGIWENQGLFWKLLQHPRRGPVRCPKSLPKWQKFEQSGSTCLLRDRRKNQFPVSRSRPPHAHAKPWAWHLHSALLVSVASGGRWLPSGAMPTASKEHAPGSAIRGWSEARATGSSLGTATLGDLATPRLDLLLRLLRLSRLAFRQLVAEVLRLCGSGSSTAARGAAVHAPGAPWPCRPGRASAARTPAPRQFVRRRRHRLGWPSPTAPRSAGRMNPGRSCSTATCSPPAVTPAPPGWDPPSPWTTAPCPPTA